MSAGRPLSVPSSLLHWGILVLGHGAHMIWGSSLFFVDFGLLIPHVSGLT